MHYELVNLLFLQELPSLCKSFPAAQLSIIQYIVGWCHLLRRTSLKVNGGLQCNVACQVQLLRARDTCDAGVHILKEMCHYGL